MASGQKYIQLQNCHSNQQIGNPAEKVSEEFFADVFHATLTLHDVVPYHTETSDLQSKLMDWFLYDKDLAMKELKRYLLAAT